MSYLLLFCTRSIIQQYRPKTGAPTRGDNRKDSKQHSIVLLRIVIPRSAIIPLRATAVATTGAAQNNGSCCTVGMVLLHHFTGREKTETPTLFLECLRKSKTKQELRTAVLRMIHAVVAPDPGHPLAKWTYEQTHAKIRTCTCSHTCLWRRRSHAPPRVLQACRPCGLSSSRTMATRLHEAEFPQTLDATHAAVDHQQQA